MSRYFGAYLTDILKKLSMEYSHGSQIILSTILFTSWVLSNKNLLPLMGIYYLMICIFPSFHSFLSFYMQIDKSLWAWRCESICRRYSQMKEQTQVGVCSTAHLIDKWASSSISIMDGWLEWSDCLAILWPSNGIQPIIPWLTKQSIWPKYIYRGDFFGQNLQADEVWKNTKSSRRNKYLLWVSRP